jgi:hypothetical protein
MNTNAHKRTGKAAVAVQADMTQKADIERLFAREQSKNAI